MHGLTCPGKAKATPQGCLPRPGSSPGTHCEVTQTQSFRVRKAWVWSHLSASWFKSLQCTCAIYYSWSIVSISTNTFNYSRTFAFKVPDPLSPRSRAKIWETDAGEELFQQIRERPDSGIHGMSSKVSPPLCHVSRGGEAGPASPRPRSPIHILGRACLFAGLHLWKNSPLVPYLTCQKL